MIYLVAYFIEGQKYEFEKKLSLEKIKNKIKNDRHNCIVSALINNTVQDLSVIPPAGSEIDFLNISDVLGNRIYRRSLILLMIYAVYDLFPEGKISVNHSINNGIYCELNKNKLLQQDDVKKIENRMWELVEEDCPIESKKYSFSEAKKILNAQGFKDKVDILKQQDKETYKLYRIKDYHDYLYYNMVPSTKYLDKFKLHYSFPGFVLLFPQRDNPDNVPEFKDQPKLGKVIMDYEKFGQIMGVSYANQLNKRIEQEEYSEIIKIAEAMQEKKISQIADEIEKNIKEKKVILIAGPSSSGKTTFSQRLSIQLRITGLFPVRISLDNYFRDRKNTPQDEEGNYSFEDLEAIDLNLLNNHLIKLLQGEKVEIPKYNFEKGKKEFTGKRIKLNKNQPIILEGIHGLNNQLTNVIPDEHKFKIYVSALTQINIDSHNRIPTTDTRKIRRLIRDHKFRGHGVIDTLRLWPSVREGEDKNIFPFQENADIMFNSALVYELPVLKKYALPLLKKINQDCEMYYEAQRLIEILECFKTLETQEIPLNSLLREFIGQSNFRDSD